MSDTTWPEGHTEGEHLVDQFRGFKLVLLGYAGEGEDSEYPLNPWHAMVTHSLGDNPFTEGEEIHISNEMLARMEVDE